MSTELGDWRRTHDNGSLRADDVGADVTLMGWVHNRRDLGGLLRVAHDLGDSRAVPQVDEDQAAAPALVASEVRNEYVVAVRAPRMTALVAARSTKNQ